MNKTFKHEWRLVGLRFLALPIAILAPFWLISFTGAKCLHVVSSYVANGHQTISLGELELRGNAVYLQLMLLALFTCFLLISFIRIGHKKYRLRYQLARTHFVAAACSAFVSVIAYVPLHNISQRKYPPTWSCDANNVLSGGLSDKAHVGLGLDSITVTVMVFIYLLAPLTMLLVTRPKSQKLWEVR